MADKKPDAPGQYRTSWLDSIDLPFVISLFSCLTILILTVVYLRSLPAWQNEDSEDLSEFSERVARILMPLRPPDAPRLLPKREPKPLTRPKPDAKSQKRASRIDNARQTAKNMDTKRSETAVMAILSGKSTRGDGTRRVTASRSGNLPELGGLEDRLNALKNMTRFGSGSSVPNDMGAGGIDPGFGRARTAGAQKIGSIEVARPKLTGSVMKQASGPTLEKLTNFISRNQTILRLLYEERLRLQPDLKGKITVLFTILPDGQVKSAAILPAETTLDDQPFLEELLRRVRRWVFPTFSGTPVELKSPFVFTPL